METNDSAPSLAQNPNADAGWSGSEFDDAPPSRTNTVRRKSVLSEDEMGKAAVCLAVIIFGFAATGLFLSHFLPARQNASFLNCVHIEQSVQRLSCYDRAANEAATPFKGGSPFSTYSRSELQTSGPG